MLLQPLCKLCALIMRNISKVHAHRATHSAIALPGRWSVRLCYVDITDQQTGDVKYRKVFVVAVQETRLLLPAKYYSTCITNRGIIH